jgi:hypothetical protein
LTAFFKTKQSDVQLRHRVVSVCVCVCVCVCVWRVLYVIFEVTGRLPLVQTSYNWRQLEGHASYYIFAPEYQFSK